MNRKIASLALLLAASVSVTDGQLSQQVAKKPLVIVCGCDESNPRMLESAIRDAVALSPRYYDFRPSTNDKAPYYRLVLVAIDDDVSTIAVSFFVLRGDSFVTSGVRVCGINKMAWCANNILASADHAIQSL